MKTITVEAYDFDLHLSIGGEPKKIAQYIHRKVKKSNGKLSESDIEEMKLAISDKNTAAFYQALDLHGHGLMWFRSEALEQLNVIVLSHEIIHACVHMFSRIGSNVNDETEENFCYLHDFLMKKCLMEISNVKNGNNTKARQPARNVQKLDKGDQPNPEA